MTGRYVRVFLTVLLLLAVASPTFAARRSSLSGNLLIQDADDMFFFPQLVSMNKRMVTFDFGPSAGLGSGGMVFGTEQVTVGLFAHRSDFLGSITNAYFTRGDIDNIFDDGEINLGVGPDALNWIDVLAGFQAGENPIGIRLSIARGNNDPNDPPAETIQDDVTAFNVVLGARLAQFGADGSIEFAYASATEENTPAVGTEEFSPFHIGVALRRTAMDESDALFLGWLGMFSYTSGSVDFTPPPPGAASSTDISQMRLQVGAGPVYRPNDRTNVAMYGTFEYLSDTDEDAVAKNTSSEFVIPGWNVAAELEVTSWMQFRSGLRSRFVFATDKSEPVGGTAAEDKFNRLDYEWTTGIGLRFGNFTLDGYLDPSVITTGTDFLGEAGDLFGLVTTSFHF